jgi:O-acetyl-ADP-ribose deacetylase (regulator of RNase III)
MNWTRLSIEACTLELVQGNITDQVVDAIVNAANSSLAGGGGVDGAIHHRGGPSILAETSQRYPAGCPTGSAVISGAGKLSAKYIIHAVGPVWNDGDSGEPELLARVHRRCLELANGHECRSIAFPAISTGVFRYPLEKAAEIALHTTLNYLKQHGAPGLVRFVLFGEDAYHSFERILQRLSRGFSMTELPR